MKKIIEQMKKLLDVYNYNSESDYRLNYEDLKKILKSYSSVTKYIKVTYYKINSKDCQVVIRLEPIYRYIKSQFIVLYIIDDKISRFYKSLTIDKLDQDIIEKNLFKNIYQVIDNKGNIFNFIDNCFDQVVLEAYKEYDSNHVFYIIRDGEDCFITYEHKTK